MSPLPATSLLCVIVVLLASPLFAQPPDTLPLAEVEAVFTADELPEGLRLTFFTSYVRDLAAGGSSYIKLQLNNHGLEISDKELDLLVDLYGDFDERQQALHQKVIPSLEYQPEQAAAFGRFLQIEKAEHAGEVLGTWLASLRDAGQPTDEFLRNILASEHFDMTMSAGGHTPTPEQLRHRAERFAEGFQRGYGERLDMVLGSAPARGRP